MNPVGGFPGDLQPRKRGRGGAPVRQKTFLSHLLPKKSNDAEGPMIPLVSGRITWFVRAVVAAVEEAVQPPEAACGQAVNSRGDDHIADLTGPVRPAVMWKCKDGSPSAA